MKIKLYCLFFVLLLLNTNAKAGLVCPEAILINSSWALCSYDKNIGEIFHVKVDNKEALITHYVDLLLPHKTTSGSGIRLVKLETPITDTTPCKRSGAASSAAAPSIFLFNESNELQSIAMKANETTEHIPITSLNMQISEIISSDALGKDIMGMQPVTLALTPSELSIISKNSKVFNVFTDVTLWGSVTDRGDIDTQYFLSKFSRLKKIFFTQLKVNSLSGLVNSKDTLEEIIILYCRYLFPDALSALSGCGKLKKVILDNLSIVSLAGLEDSRNTLEEIEIASCDNLPANALSALSGCSRLRKVTLYDLGINSLWLRR